MELVNLVIYPAPSINLNALNRALAISAELLRVKRPISQQGDVAEYLFEVRPHPTQDLAIITANLYDVINVHPDNNLSGLIALFPDLPEAELQAKAGAIANATAFRVIDVLPSNHTTITTEAMHAQGWFPNQEPQL